MLSPNDGNWIPLLPQDRQIMEITGMSEQQYRAFMRETMLRNGLKPGDPVAFDPITLVVSLVIGIALSAIAALLMPRPRQQKAPEYETKKVQGQDVQNSNRFTPTSGFASVQNVVELGSTVPLVYANRQQIDGVAYGGVRVSTNLLWSQLYSLGNAQLLRALFLVGEGTIPQLDVQQFAIGNNVLGNYLLDSTTAGRLSLYYSPDGGRVTSADNVAGLQANLDPGNAENSGGADVFQVRSAANRYEPDFCYVETPSNQTTFGLYSHLGNNFSFKVNPRMVPEVNLTSDSSGDVKCPLNRQEVASRWKQNMAFPGRAGLIGNGPRGVTVGETLNYSIYRETDGKGFFSEPKSGEEDAIVTLGDVGSAVASRQENYDDNISVGNLYRIGSAMAICTQRSGHAFVSNNDSTADNAGRSITAQFQVVRAGTVQEWPSGTLNPSPYQGDQGQNPTPLVDSPITCTKSAQIFRCAEASFSTERVCQVAEIGLRSSLNLSVNGLMNFADTTWNDGGTLRARTYDVIDNQACRSYEGSDIDGISSINYQSGTYAGPETRYSFFIVAVKEAATDDPFIELPFIFGTRGQGGTATFNYLRFDFGESKRWEFRLTPISSWEVRTAQGILYVLDYRGITSSISSQGITIHFTGNVVQNTVTDLGLPMTRTIGNQSLGVPFDDYHNDQGFYVDAFGRTAENFIYNEITASTNQPEHTVVYLNTVSENKLIPNYDGLALVGMNIRSGQEITQLNQFSVYVNKGINNTSHFPDVLYDLLSNKKYGAGKIVSLEQIDKASFDYCRDWAAARKYFFDGAIVEKINIRNWAAENSVHFLLEFVIRNGKFALQPVANFDGPETIKGLYTAGNIIDDSFALNYLDEQDRIPPRISVKWREERQSTAVDNKGLFPVVREVTVRESTTDEDAPLEQIDLSDFCTSLQQAIDRAKWECRSRRLITHTVAFKTTPTEVTLDIGAVFKLGLETFSYDSPTNGAIDADGFITSWPELPDGSHDVLIWDGTTQTIAERTLSVTNGRTDKGPAVFSLKTVSNDAQTYRTQSLGFDEDGMIDVEATFFPTDEDYVSELVRDWDDPSKWIIEGDQS